MGFSGIFGESNAILIQVLGPRCLSVGRLSHRQRGHISILSVENQRHIDHDVAQQLGGEHGRKEGYCVLKREGGTREDSRAVNAVAVYFLFYDQPGRGFGK